MAAVDRRDFFVGTAGAALLLWEPAACGAVSGRALRELRSAVREPAFFGRLGGEEFLIALPDTSLENACAAADRFREQIMNIDTTRWFPARRRITASIGVTVSKPGVCSSSDMLVRADGALYAAKRAGRNCIKSSPELAGAWAEGPQKIFQLP